MIVRRAAQPQGFGFWDLLIGAVSGVLGQAKPATQCPTPPPLTFVQRPEGLIAVGVGAGVVGLLVGTLLAGGK